MTKYLYLKDNEAATPVGIWAWAKRLVESLNKNDQATTIPVGVKVGWHPGVDVPTSWLATDGASLPVAGYPVLFNLIGYAYGGAGDTFDLPTEADTIIKV